MSQHASQLIDQYRASRNDLKKAIDDGCAMEELKVLDRQLSQSYDAVLAHEPTTPAEIRYMVDFLLDQLAYFSDLNYDQPELAIIKRIVAKLTDEA